MTKIKIKQIIQILALALSIGLIIFLNNSSKHVAHEYCPFSVVCFGLTSLFSNIKGFIFPITIIGSILLLISTLFLGRMFCGYVCPFGTIQEFIHGLNKPSHYFKQRIPYKVHKIINYLKYLILIIILILVILNRHYLYMKLCPVFNLSHLQSAGFFILGMTVLIFLLSYFVDRFFCRYLCPYAALMNIFVFISNKLKIKRKTINRNITTSLECFNCLNYCPMYIDIGYNMKVKNPNCIHCRRCIRKCKKSNKSKKDCLYSDV